MGEEKNPLTPIKALPGRINTFPHSKEEYLNNFAKVEKTQQNQTGKERGKKKRLIREKSESQHGGNGGG